MRCEFQKPVVKILTFIEYICDFCPEKRVSGGDFNKFWSNGIQECYFCKKDTCEKCRKEWHKGYSDSESDQYYEHSFYICPKCCPLFEEITKDYWYLFYKNNDIYQFEEEADRIYKTYKTLQNYLAGEIYEQ